MIQNTKLEIGNSEPGLAAVKLLIRGDVQGVSYRYFTRTMAENLGLIGWAKNEEDGTVTVFVQGRVENIEKIIEWCKTGSPMSTVEKVESEEASMIDGLKGFEIK